jgi:hypothetical protein
MYMANRKDFHKSVYAPEQVTLNGVTHIGKEHLRIISPPVIQRFAAPEDGDISQAFPN